MNDTTEQARRMLVFAMISGAIITSIVMFLLVDLPLGLRLLIVAAIVVGDIVALRGIMGQRDRKKTSQPSERVPAPRPEPTKAAAEPQADVPAILAGGDLTRGSLLRLTPQTFEDLCLQSLRDLGFSQIHAHHAMPSFERVHIADDPGGRRAFIHVRRFRTDQDIPRQALAGFSNLRREQEQTDLGVFMTTASLSPQAIELAEQEGIVCFDGGDVVEMARLVLPILPDVDTGPPPEFCASCGAERMNPHHAFCSLCQYPFPSDT